MFKNPTMLQVDLPDVIWVISHGVSHAIIASKIVPSKSPFRKKPLCSKSLSFKLKFT